MLDLTQVLWLNRVLGRYYDLWNYYWMALVQLDLLRRNTLNLLEQVMIQCLRGYVELILRLFIKLFLGKRLIENNLLLTHKVLEWRVR
jgi:hypothetical protein